MKKYLLTSLLGVFGLVGAFASATDYTFVSEDNSDWEPNTITFSNSFTLTVDSVSSYVLNGNDFNTIVLGKTSDGSNVSLRCGINYEDGFFSISSYYSNCNIEGGVEYYIYGSDGDNFSSITISDTPVSSGGDSSGTLLPNGTDDLKTIIGGLESTMAEFVPYIAYIGLGIIVACLGFVAIRRLVNWVRAKIFDNF